MWNDTPEIAQMREAVRALCSDFPGSYWREKDRERAILRSLLMPSQKLAFSPR